MDHVSFVSVAGAGKSLSLDADHLSALDNDVASNWCLTDSVLYDHALQNHGTPNDVNGQCAL